MAEILEEEIPMTAKKVKQILNYDISAPSRGSNPEDYKVSLRVECFDVLDDGRTVLDCKSRANFIVNDRMTDSEGNPIAERVQLMEDFTRIMYEILEEIKTEEAVVITQQPGLPSGLVR